MSVLTISQAHSQPFFTKKKLKTVWKRCVKVYDHHLDIIKQIGLVAVNTCNLVAQIFPKLPELFGSVSLAIYNYGGVIYLKDLAQEVIKNGFDIYHAVKSRDFLGLFFTAAKTATTGINTLLVCGMFTASIFTLFGFPAVTVAMYAVMKTVGTISLFTEIGLQISDYAHNKYLLYSFKQIREKGDTEIRTEQVMHHFVTLLRNPALRQNPKRLVKLDSATLKEKQLATRIFRQMDRYTVDNVYREGLEKKLKNQGTIDHPYLRHLFEETRKTVQKMQENTRSALAFHALGYIGRIVYRMNPGSVSGWIVQWEMSILWLIQRIHFKMGGQKTRKAVAKGPTT